MTKQVTKHSHLPSINPRPRQYTFRSCTETCQSTLGCGLAPSPYWPGAGPHRPVLLDIPPLLCSVRHSQSSNAVQRSAHGRKPEVTAPGSELSGLRAAGTYLEQEVVQRSEPQPAPPARMHSRVFVRARPRGRHQGVKVYTPDPVDIVALCYCI